MERKMKKISTKTLVIGAALTAVVIVLQMLGAFISFGMFQVSLVLAPIVIGAAIGGVGLGAWLGFVFGVVVLLNGDAAGFLAIDVFGTIVTVLLKGTLSGLAAALVYKAFEKKNKYLAVILAAIVCPVVNTGVFLLGCFTFFMEAIKEWAGGGDLVNYFIMGLGIINFPVELLFNIILSPAILRLLNIKEIKKVK